MYEIYVDDSLIFRTGADELQPASAVLDMEVGKVDSFEFTLYPNHPFYSSLGRLKPIVTVWRDQELLFRGRILNMETSFYGERKITCEGDLGYLSDSIIRPYDFSSQIAMTPYELLQFFINAHNEQVDDFKQFELGAVTVQANATLAVSDEGYSTAWEAINNALINEIGGYITVTHTVSAGGEITTAINLVSDFAALASQTIEFGRNLTDFTRKLEGEEVITGIIPLGEDDDDGNPLTISSVNNGKDYLLDEEAAAVYGRIFKAVEFDHVNDPEYLMELGERYLEDAVKESASLDLSAVDLAMLDSSIEAFSVGELVRVKSEPHGIDDTYLLSKMTIDLLSASASKLTLGATYKTLTEQAIDQNRAYGSLTMKLQKQLQDIVVSTKDIEMRQITLQNGWTGAEGYSSPYYYRTSDGIMVYLSGVLTGGPAEGSAVAFVLETGFRPPEVQYFQSAGRDIVIGTEGNVTIQGGDIEAEIPLNSIYFRTAPLQQEA